MWDYKTRSGSVPSVVFVSFFHGLFINDWNGVLILLLKQPGHRNIPNWKTTSLLCIALTIMEKVMT